MLGNALQIFNLSLTEKIYFLKNIKKRYIKEMTKSSEIKRQ